MMDQALVNWLLAGFGGLIGFLLNVVWQAVKDLQKAAAQFVGVIGHGLASGAALAFRCASTKSCAASQSAAE